MLKTPSVAPKERVNITYQSAIQAAEQIKLLLKMLLLGDFSPSAAYFPLEARPVLSLDKENFDAAMASRNALITLKGLLGDIPTFTQTLRQILHDPKTRERLVEQLYAIDGVGEHHVV